MTIDQQIEILQAIKEGKKLRAKSKHVLSNPGWDLWIGAPNFVDFDYEIVREPRRWIIYRIDSRIYAQPYSQTVPYFAKVICTAVEELTPSPEVVDKFIEDTNNELAKRP